MIACHVSFWAVIEFTQSPCKESYCGNLIAVVCDRGRRIQRGQVKSPGLEVLCWSNWIGLHLHQCKLGLWFTLVPRGEIILKLYRKEQQSSCCWCWANWLYWLRDEEGPKRTTKLGELLRFFWLAWVHQGVPQPAPHPSKPQHLPDCCILQFSEQTQL